MRFETSKSGTKEVGLDAYIANMKEGQKSIYYLAGQHRAANFALQYTNAAATAAAAAVALGVAQHGLPTCLPASCLLAAAAAAAAAAHHVYLHVLLRGSACHSFEVPVIIIMR